MTTSAPRLSIADKISQFGRKNQYIGSIITISYRPQVLTILLLCIVTELKKKEKGKKERKKERKTFTFTYLFKLSYSVQPMEDLSHVQNVKYCDLMFLCNYWTIL